MPSGYFFESASGVCFPEKENIKYTLGLLNSNVINAFAEVVNPTLTLQSGDVGTIPVIVKDQEKVSYLVDKAIDICKKEWDSYEISWDFQRHPLVKEVDSLSEIYTAWDAEKNHNFDLLKTYEEKINRTFILNYS